MSYYSPTSNGRADNGGNDTPDILVPPLLASASSSRNSNGNGATGGQGGKESSDSRKW